MSKEDDIKKLISEHNRRLQYLKEREAKTGLETPPHVLTEIEDIEEKIEQLQDELDVLKAMQSDIRNDAEESPSSDTSRLCEKITLEQWHTLEYIAIRAVIAGGMAAMGYYDRALPWLPVGVMEGVMGVGDREEQENKNPSTIADFEATARVLETINSMLTLRIRHKELNCMISYLGEETQTDKYTSWFDKHVEIPDRVLPANKFFTREYESNRIRIIVDAIDGTVNFSRRLPFFCSAVAMLVEDEARVSAIYDPTHHIVYSALLRGPHGRPEKEKEAWAWQVSTGSRVNLVEVAQKDTDRILKNRSLEELTKGAKRQLLQNESVATHLTRTKIQYLEEFLRPHSDNIMSQLERLAKASGGIYTLNSGVLAMAYIATGALGGFVNNITHHWDLAAGEVLVRACGGKVTDFNGNKIKYSTSSEKTSVIAAKEYLYEPIKEILNA
jgi:fructose-1,6-bisphosphatase/inositol monophosphatase family enzyme